MVFQQRECGFQGNQIRNDEAVRGRTFGVSTNLERLWSSANRPISNEFQIVWYERYMLVVRTESRLETGECQELELTHQKSTPKGFVASTKNLLGCIDEKLSAVERGNTRIRILSSDPRALHAHPQPVVNRSSYVSIINVTGSGRGIPKRR